MGSEKNEPLITRRAEGNGERYRNSSESTFIVNGAFPSDRFFTSTWALRFSATARIMRSKSFIKIAGHADIALNWGRDVLEEVDVLHKAVPLRQGFGGQPSLSIWAGLPTEALATWNPRHRGQSVRTGQVRMQWKSSLSPFLLFKKGHTYRIVVSDLERGRPIWVGGQGRTEADLDRFFLDLGPTKTARIRLAVMDMWKAFRNSMHTHAPQAQILFDKFHILRHLADAMDQVRRAEYKRVATKDQAFIKGQRYTLLSHRANLTLAGRRSLQANKRLATAYLLKEEFGQLWAYRRAGWARQFFLR